MILQEHVPLAPLTTLKVGGTARYFVFAQTEQDITEALSFARERSIPLRVLGGGSNVLVADEGFPGLILAIGIAGINIVQEHPSVEVRVGAGVAWDEFVAWSISKNFTGLERLSGIPGTVGGAVVANIGAYGAECSDTFLFAEAIDRTDGSQKVFLKDDCAFNYHHSVFGEEPYRFVVTHASFTLSTHSSSHVSYQDYRFDIAKLSQSLGKEPSLTDIREMILSIREQKGYVIIPGRTSFQSAGSFFHMPYLSSEAYTQVRKKAQTLDPKKEEHLRPWSWQQPDGTYKIAPGFLLEYTEFQKGYTRGAVGISPRHILSIITHEGACAKDVAALASDMQREVYALFGVTLTREVKYIGMHEHNL